MPSMLWAVALRMHAASGALPPHALPCLQRMAAQLPASPALMHGKPMTRRHGGYLDEGAAHKETVGEPDLHAAQNWADASAVRGQVGEVCSDQRRGGHGGLQHAHEGVAVEGLDHLELRISQRGAQA